MSRSNPTTRTPVTRYFQWSAADEKGYVSYYDKEKGDNGEEVVMDFPFEFLPLDELHTISGYSESDKSRIFSNEVRKLDQTIYVRTQNGVKFTGTYEEVKDQAKAMGGKYAKALYIAYKNEDGEFVTAKLLLVGSSLTAWINFAKTCDPFSHKIAVTGKEGAKKGATKYNVPVFAKLEATDEENAAATELDVQLQAYLLMSLNQPQEEEKPRNSQVDESEDNPIDLSDIPFN